MPQTTPRPTRRTRPGCPVKLHYTGHSWLPNPGRAGGGGTKASTFGSERDVLCFRLTSRVPGNGDGERAG